MTTYLNVATAPDAVRTKSANNCVNVPEVCELVLVVRFLAERFVYATSVKLARTVFVATGALAAAVRATVN
jgi:hypothetical protein